VLTERRLRHDLFYRGAPGNCHFKYTIRLKANAILQDSIADLLKRPVGRRAPGRWDPKEWKFYGGGFQL
jgi:hypothetical protein